MVGLVLSMCEGGKALQCNTLSIVGLKNKTHTPQEFGFFNSQRRWLGFYRDHAGHDHPGLVS